MQQVKIPVTAAPAPFQRGVAYALAELSVRSPNYYSYANTGREIINVESRSRRPENGDALAGCPRSGRCCQSRLTESNR